VDPSDACVSFADVARSARDRYLSLSLSSCSFLVAGTNLGIGTGNVLSLDSESIYADEADNTELQVG